MSAATVPRVRTIVICDEAILSEIEAEVYTLENVRIGVEMDSFPQLRFFPSKPDKPHQYCGPMIPSSSRNTHNGGISGATSTV